MPSDAELLVAWRDGDTDAGEALVRRHFGSVYRFFANKAGGDIDDLIQRTFLACVEGRERVRDAASLRAYVLGIARIQLLVYVRGRRRDGLSVSIDDLCIAQIQESPSRVAAGREEERLLLGALRELPVELQTTVELFYWEELSIGQVAEILEIPEGTVKSRLHRARDLLRDKIERMDLPPGLRESVADGFEVWARALRAAVRPRPSESQEA